MTTGNLADPTPFVLDASALKCRHAYPRIVNDLLGDFLLHRADVLGPTHI
jgi:hypothetical protein